jgi:hypothetical protein
MVYLMCICILLYIMYITDKVYPNVYMYVNNEIYPYVHMYIMRNKERARGLMMDLYVCNIRVYFIIN